jgi:hypothetical protein
MENAEDRVTEVKKPPIGLYPRLFWIEDRIREIQEAVSRYAQLRKRPPDEWEIELKSLWKIHDEQAGKLTNT